MNEKLLSEYIQGILYEASQSFFPDGEQAGLEVSIGPKNIQRMVIGSAISSRKNFDFSPPKAAISTSVDIRLNPTVI